MTISGKEVKDIQVKLRANAIIKNLNLKKSDKILDLCCGNGMITKELASHVSHIYAIDFSRGLIETAKNNNKLSNITYMVGDITKVNYRKFKGIKKISVSSCIQYLSSKNLLKFLRRIAELDNVLVYASNIPDKKKIWYYYNTEEKKAFYLNSVKKGTPHIGTWFDKIKLKNMAAKCGLKTKFIKIEKSRNTSSYRFDVIFKK